MREAIGSSWILYIAIIFILIYIFFIGFVMNYAAAYRAANYVVTQIENCQGQMDNCGDVNMVNITEIVRKEYHYITPNIEPNIGGVITPVCFTNGTGVVYRVTLPVEFDLPLLGSLRWMMVKAETKTIQNTSCK